MKHPLAGRFFALFLFFIAHTSSLSGDVVLLKNGDRLSGKVVSSNAEVLEMTTEFLGDVEIQWDAVSEIQSDEKLYVSTASGQVLVGPVATEGDALQVQTAESGEVRAPLAEVAALRNPDAQAEFRAEIERLRNPKLTDFWKGFFDTGLALTSGNAETRSFTNSAGATRSTSRDTIKLYFTSVFSQADLGPEAETETTANAVRGGTRYEVNVNEKLFTFGFIDLEFDQFQDLDLRNVLGGGLGYHFIKNDRSTLDFFAGSSFNQEFFENDVTRRSGELVTGQEFSYSVSDRTSLTERLAFYPNLSDSGEYRLQFDTALTTNLFEWLGWNVTLSDRFLSNPVPGRQKNDVLLTTGVRLIFGDEKLR